MYHGREPWSSGYGRRLTILRSWVWIPAPYTGWTWHFFTLICCKNCNNVCLKKTENKRKRGRGWPIFKKRDYRESKYEWYDGIAWAQLGVAGEEGLTVHVDHDSFRHWRRDLVGRDAEVGAHVGSRQPLELQFRAFHCLNWNKLLALYYSFIQ